MLDDCNFHECVNLDNFDMAKSVTLRPPDGEVGCRPRAHTTLARPLTLLIVCLTRAARMQFTLMNYRISGEAGGVAGAAALSLRLATRRVCPFYVSFRYVLLLRRTVTQSLASEHAAIGALKHPLPFRVSAVVEESLAPGRCAPAAHKRAWH